MNLKTKKTLEIIGALIPALLVIFLGASSAFAQTEFTPLVTVDGLFDKGVETNPVKILSGIYGFAIGIGSVIAVIMIIWGGFEYMYQESFSVKSAAKERISNAFIGLGVILASFIILQTINKDLVDFNLNLPGASGQLRGLITESQKFEDELEGSRNQLNKAAKEAALRRGDIADIKNDITKTENQITKLNEDLEKAKADGDKEKTKELETQISNLKKDNEEKIVIVSLKKLEDISLTSKSLINEARANLVSEALKTHGKDLGKEEIANLFFETINNRSNVQEEITESNIKKIQQTIIDSDNNIEVKELAEKKIKEMKENIEYIRLSKGVLVYSLTLKYPKNSTNDIYSQSRRFDDAMLSYEGSARTLEKKW